MSFETEIIRDVVEMEAEQPTFFQWRQSERDGSAVLAAAVSCVADKFTRETMITDDGNPVTIDLSLRARVDLFANHQFPRSGQIIRFPVDAAGADLPDSTDYRVRRTRSKQLSILWVDCIDLNV